MTLLAVDDRGVDLALVNACKAGDDGAFTVLCERYQTPIWNHCYRMLGDPEEAHEATQDTLLNAWLALPATAPDTRFKAWLYRIATNVCLDALRRRRVVSWTRMDAVLAADGEPLYSRGGWAHAFVAPRDAEPEL